MSDNLEIGVEGRVGVIALNRPEAINALTAPMIEAIAETLEIWREDDNVRAILFEGRGPRGFCSGGDVRQVREWMLGDERARKQAQRFFADEYAMNYQIASYDKPIVALVDGICMGGGIGIAGHARFRFASDRARFAMPEAGIGLFCDIGVNAILAKAPPARALLFELTGQAVGAADARALGLTDSIVPADRLDEVRAGIIAAGEAGDIETTLVALMHSLAVEPGEPVFCQLADRLADELDGDDAAEIVAGIAERAAREPEFKAVSDQIAGRCPTTLVANVENYAAALKNPDIAAVLAADLRLAFHLSARPDFAEGVRAVLIDKGSVPAWSPASVEGVDVEQIRAQIRG